MNGNTLTQRINAELDSFDIPKGAGWDTVSRIHELGNRLIDARDLHENYRQLLHDARIENSGQAAEIERLQKHTIQAIDERDNACSNARELTAQRDEARLDVERMWALNGRLTEENRECRAEAAQLKDTVAAYEQATVKQQLTVRPEPSRLEIAAMLMQSLLTLKNYGVNPVTLALEGADALIAAAKEVVK